LSQYTPGLWAEYGVSGPGSTARQLTFRGLSVSSGLVFIDGAPYAGTGNPSIGTVERIEVLIGPQSVYFGRSTFSGAVNFVTKDPSMDRFTGRAYLEAYSYGGIDAIVRASDAIIQDKLAARVNARAFHFGGQDAYGRRSG